MIFFLWIKRGKMPPRPYVQGWTKKSRPSESEKATLDSGSGKSTPEFKEPQRLVIQKFGFKNVVFSLAYRAEGNASRRHLAIQRHLTRSNLNMYIFQNFAAGNFECLLFFCLKALIANCFSRKFEIQWIFPES